LIPAVICLLFASRLRLSPVAVLLFCQCGSDRVDIKLWNVRRAQLHCLTCGQEAWLDGFTVSEFDPAKLLAAAVVDQARKHRKRSPDDVDRIQQQRKSDARDRARR
jgi:hypothetical protein